MRGTAGTRSSNLVKYKISASDSDDPRREEKNDS